MLYILCESKIINYRSKADMYSKSVILLLLTLVLYLK